MAPSYRELLKEAKDDAEVIDKVCVGTPFAETEGIERALDLLRKWSDGADERFGADAMAYLRKQGIVLSQGKTDRRKLELSRVLNIRKRTNGLDRQDADSLLGSPTIDQQARMAVAAHLTPADSNRDSPLVGQANPEPSKNVPGLDSRLTTESLQRQEEKSGVAPQPEPLQHGSPRTLHGAAGSPTESPAADGQRSLFCHQCLRGPLDCMHSHRVIGTMVERGLQQATVDEKKIARAALQQMLDGNFRHPIEPAYNTAVMERQIRDEQETWLLQLDSDLQAPRSRLSNRAHRKTRSLGSPLEPSSRPKSANGNGPLSAPARSHTHDATASENYTPEPQENEPTEQLASSNLNRTQFAEGTSTIPTTNGVGSDGSSGKTHGRPAKPNSTHQPIAKRRTREERAWCDVCKSNGFWCIHHQKATSPLPRSARLSATYYENTPVVDSPAEDSDATEEAQAEPDPDPEPEPARKRRRTTHASKRPSRQMPLRGDSYRDSGVGLSSDDDETIDDEAMTEAAPYTSRESRRGLSDADRKLSLTSFFESATKERLVRAIVDVCMDNRLVEEWMRDEFLRQGNRAHAAANSEVLAPVEHKQSRARTSTEDPAPQREKSALPEAMTICQNCGISFDANKEIRPSECHHHPGDLLQAVRILGRERTAVIDVAKREWVIQSCPTLDTRWTCCHQPGSSQGCHATTHIAATPVEEQPEVHVGMGTGGAPVEPQAPKTELDSNSGQANYPTLAAEGPPATQAPIHSLSQPNDLPNGAQALVNGVDPSMLDTHRAESPLPVHEKALRGHSNVQMADTDYNALPDLCPPLDNLQGDPTTIFTIESPYSNPLNLSSDPDQHLLHEAERIMASKLRMSCASYLCSKRRIFQGVTEKLSKGKDYRKIHAQQACKIDARKARWLYSAFQQVGWFDPKYFPRRLPNNGPVHHYATKSMRKSAPPLPIAKGWDSDALSSVGDDDMHAPTPPRSRPDSVATDAALMPDATTGYVAYNEPAYAPSAPTPAARKATLAVNGRKQKTPSASKRRWGETFAAPANDVTPGGKKVTREVLQWRKRSDGRKEMTPTCPYPVTWAEADSIDREMVRMKRRERRAWPDIFDWWVRNGRSSLKNASCLAVRYSIMKRKFEHIWIQEEREEAQAAADAPTTQGNGEAPVPDASAAETHEIPAAGTSFTAVNAKGPAPEQSPGTPMSRETNASVPTAEVTPAEPLTAEDPAAEASAAEASAANAPAAETLTAETPTAKPSAVEPPAADLPAAEPPAAEPSAVEPPAAEPPTTNSFAMESPATEVNGEVTMTDAPAAHEDGKGQVPGAEEAVSRSEVSKTPIVEAPPAQRTVPQPTVEDAEDTETI